MPRLGSRKSRTGCAQCKTRHVKCDEGRPCSNCDRHGVECSLLSRPLPASSVTSPTPSASATPSSTLSLPFALLERTPLPPPSALPSFSDWQSDLHLMHHYTATTSRTIPAETGAQDVWTHKVPQEAFSFPFLLHTVLAFSAYHLAHLTPGMQRHYGMLASFHQMQASRGLRAALQTIDQGNCHALFASASMLALMAFAETRRGADSINGSYKPASETNDMCGETNSLEALVEISLMLRGMNAVIDDTEEMIHAGPLSSLFVSTQDKSPPPPLVALLAELKGPELARLSASSPEAAGAAWELREAMEFCIGNSPHSGLRVVFLWPIRVANDFWKVLGEGNDWGCKEVMSRYARILEQAGSEWWFLEKWKKVEWI